MKKNLDSPLSGEFFCYDKRVKKWIIGVDEVGRGPIAGPVMVCACAFNPAYRSKLSFVGLKDSKKMTPKAREAWFERVKEWQQKGIINFSLAQKSAAYIDQYGISSAIKLSLEDALEKLSFSPDSVEVLLDGSLHAPSIYTHQHTVIKGDSKHPEISLASVIAKVSRDALMKKLHKKHPHYSWFKNKGYGTKEHFNSVVKEGITPYHRQTFIVDKVHI